MQAQDGEGAGPPEARAAAEQESIVVTGSRIRTSGFNSPQPLTVIGAEQIRNLVQTNSQDVLNSIPQITSAISDTNPGNASGAEVGSATANLRGLNPFYGTRTLTLVNTRRFVPTGDGGAVDLNLIPSALIARVETVTGGASAAYGSDAVAGVVNIILDTKMTGLRAQVDSGLTFRGDGRKIHGSLAYGTSFAGDRGHIIVGIEYQDQDEIESCFNARRWCQAGWDIFENANNILPNGQPSGYNVPGSPGYGLPNYVLGRDSALAFNTPYGVVRNRAPAPLAARNYRFTADGRGIVPFDQGEFVNNSTIGQVQGSDGISNYDDASLQAGLERIVAYTAAEFALSDSLTLSGEFNYGKRIARAATLTAGPRSTFFVKATNPYVPPELAALLGGASFSFGKDLDGQIPSYSRAEVEVYRGVIALSGDLGGSWKWDAYYQYGHNERNQMRNRSRVNTPFTFALDAVRAPAGNVLGVAPGTIVCAELLKPNPNPIAVGCSPANFFGLDNLTQAAIDYVYRPVFEDFVYDQHVLAASITGDLFGGIGAGPIGFAAGGEYRTESGNVTHGDIPNYLDYAFTFGLDYGGSIKVLEGFTELNAPLLAGLPGAERLDLNGAIRYTRNSAKNRITDEAKSTTATSWKLSAIYEPLRGVRFRGSRSRDIRAAGFRELFLQQVPTDPGTSQGTVRNPNGPGGNANDATPILSGGSFQLGAEKADTTTAGIVLQPAFVPGLRFSADWFEIKLKDAVTTLSGQSIVDLCDQFDTFCDRITFNGGNLADISFIDARQVNLGLITYRGLDFELEYNLPLSDVASNWDGALTLRVLAAHQYDLKVQPDPNVRALDYAGMTGPLVGRADFNPAPAWRWNASVTYNQGGFTSVLQVRRIGSGIGDVTKVGPEDEGYDPSLPNSISVNRFDGATYVDLAMTYRIPFGSGDQNFEIFGKIENLFDKSPPIAVATGGSGGSPYPTNPVFFDTLGARFQTGVRVRY
ncbi:MULTISPECIES: TonB-dependent receptor domain-containing protein [unclassified Sphingobium]|uniref:TonB-dependent receptor domain-containing protein n=1 Tax=unclassified Sphingobium TaxID=2611147 RepID=UPI002224E3BA|nr:MULTISPECIES: TonB-dependent receptor [unclassified Sphingobium]MCW2396533.1 outer membrane receptor protein involved in Fe transport [Sphingobium sp. B8D3B]MCW2420050.1 outer membrane receptor protein involved in Fe transport [Sphingobium sp. B8D3C]